jgi:hypothetical protein
MIEGCSSLEQEIGNGYSAVKVSGFNIIITDKDRTLVVYLNVSYFKKIYNMLVGCREIPEVLLKSDVEFTSGFGWFLLNLSTGSLRQTLGLAEIIRDFPDVPNPHFSPGLS